MKKFTQEIKDNWLKALKSGKYKQGFGKLTTIVNGEIRHCCIGVLGDCTEGLEAKTSPEHSNPYNFLIDNGIQTTEIWIINDLPDYQKRVLGELQEPDYSNVIPLIEQLPVKS